MMLLDLTENKLNLFLRKKLINGKKKIKSGRNNKGFITLRHKGGRVKRVFRLLNFQCFFWNCYGLVMKFVYDPNRNTPIMLICFFNGILSYHLAIKDLKIGSLIFIGNLKNRENFSIGSINFLYNLTEGLLINSLEIKKLKGAQYVRSAGTSAQLLKVDKIKKQVLIRLPSKEERFFFFNNICTLGQVANLNQFLLHKSTAGRNRYLGIRPTVRGVAMNPIDHPHGGGQGKTSGAGGFRSQVTFKGKVAKTQPTRSKKKKNKFLVKTRKKLRIKIK